MLKIYASRAKRAKRRKAIRSAVSAHRAALAAQGLARIETFVDAAVADELRARAKAAGMPLRAFVAQFLTAAIRD